MKGTDNSRMDTTAKLQYELLVSTRYGDVYGVAKNTEGEIVRATGPIAPSHAALWENDPEGGWTYSAKALQTARDTTEWMSFAESGL